MALQRSEIWRSVAVKGVPDRADSRLRSFARKEGDAVFCRLCDGDGVIIRRAYARAVQQPVKCNRCGGEGLEPSE